jgi:acetate---CoA ligase (ADP-forming) subunit beta
MDTDSIINEGLKKGLKTLSEHSSKLLIEAYGIPITPEKLVGSADEAVAAAAEISYPVVLKAEGPEIAHKTERQLVAVGLRDDEDVRKAYDQIVKNLADSPFDGMLVQKMIKGERELVIGLVRDPQFGPCVMFGLGGIFTEVLKDTSFRVAPITEDDAMQMMDDIRAKAILGPVRGMAPANREKLAKALVGLGKIGIDKEAVAEIDVNPLIIGSDGEPVAVDALVVLAEKS